MARSGDKAPVHFRALTSGVAAKVYSSPSNVDLTTETEGNNKVCRALMYSGTCTVVDAGGNTVVLPDTGGYFYLPLQCQEITSGTDVIAIW